MATSSAKYPNRLRALIKQAGFTVKEVAEESGIPLRTLFGYCKGNMPIPHQRIEELAALIGCSPHALVPPLPQVFESFPSTQGHLEQTGITQTPVIQLEQEREVFASVAPRNEAPLVDAFVVQSEQRERESISLTVSPLPMLSQEQGSFDIATWFGIRVNDLKTLWSWQGPVVTCQERQALIHEEIKQWSEMADQQQTQEYQISRRVALATLATLSTSLLAKIQSGPFNTLILQEFLAQCATSFATCWHLLNNGEFAIVQQTLARSLPTLCSLGQQPSSAQSTAAYLASQGCLLNGLLSLHILPQPQNFHRRLFYCTKATTFAALAGEPDLHIAALTQLANARYNLGQPETMLQTYQQATFLLQEYSSQHEFSSLLHSKLQAGLAHAYAQQGKTQEALRALQEARTIFPVGDETAPVHLTADYGRYSLLLFEGMVHLDLDTSSPGNNHAQQAVEALAQVETISASTPIPDRFRIEIINQQGLAAVRTGDRDRFCYYLHEGIQGAKALASEKRRQEAIANWKAAQVRWPHEPALRDLADLFL